MTNRIEHKPEQSTFEIYVDDALAGHVDYAESNGVRNFHHTATDPDFRGQGIAGKVVTAALDATRADGLKIIAGCSYVEKFVADNPEYRDLLAT